jgi:hypothetical protein
MREEIARNAPECCASSRISRNVVSEECTERRNMAPFGSQWFRDLHALLPHNVGAIPAQSCERAHLQEQLMIGDWAGIAPTSSPCLRVSVVKSPSHKTMFARQ